LTRADGAGQSSLLLIGAPIRRPAGEIEHIVMDLLACYPRLKGSHGQVRLMLRQGLLDQVCALLTARFHDRVRDIRITPSGTNRFRIQAALSNRFYQWAGSIGLRVLREQGIEIRIDQPSASPEAPTIDGSMDTTAMGKSVAVPAILQAINDGLGAGEAIRLRESRWLGWTRFRVLVSLHPFLLLRKLLPAGIGNHITHVRWQTTRDAFVIDLTWQHSGISGGRRS
jgi:hypothetical protein